MDDERRSFPRRPAKGNVLCRLDRLGMGPQHRGKLMDISQSGASFTLPVAVDAGQEVQLEFPSKGASKPFATSVTVIRTTEDDAEGWQVFAELHSRMPYAFFLDLTR